jgi:hypothetical protein
VVGDAVRRACLGALADMPDHERDLCDSLAILKVKLTGGAVVDLDNCKVQEIRLLGNADGFHRPRAKGVEYVIRAAAFEKWFKTKLMARLVLEWLDEEGVLETGRTRKTKDSNGWAQQQPKWLNDKRVRSFVIYLPAGLEDLDV